MFSESRTLLEHGNADLAQAARRPGISLDEMGQLDGTGQTRGAATHEENIDLDTFIGRRIPDDDAIQRQQRLRVRGPHTRHRQPPRTFRISSVRRGTISNRSPTTP